MKLVILGISGRKSCGKSSLSRAIRQHWRGVKPPYVPHVAEYGVADDFKWFCVNVLGLTQNQAFGSNADKDSPVEHLLWENFPVPAWLKEDGSTYLGIPDGMMALRFFGTPEHEVRTATKSEAAEIWRQHAGLDDLIWGWDNWHDGQVLTPKTGPMKAREVMEEWAHLALKAYPRSAVNGVLRKIRSDYDELIESSQVHRYMASTPTPRPAMIALIDSVRFPHDVQAIQERGGVVLRLTRNPFPDSTSLCETALDPDKFDWALFDKVHKNDGETPEETFWWLKTWLTEKGVL